VQGLKNLDCLLPNTRKLLIKMIKECDFLDKYILVGGSALAMYLCHRKSEDLDFFTFGNDFDKKEIFEYIKTFETKEILNQTPEQIDIVLNGVKVTFFNANWKFLKPIKVEKFNLASIDSISAMKVNVLFLRAKYRDYYDLYCLVKSGISLKEIFEYSKNIVEGINFKLFAIALVYIDDIEDDNIEYLEPVERISKEEIRDFFQKKIDEIISS
jgi:predicted nucleotidyltransferase component of viral defense system